MRQPASEHTDADASNDWLAPAAKFAVREKACSLPSLHRTTQDMAQCTATLHRLSSFKTSASSRDGWSSCVASTHSAGGRLPSSSAVKPGSEAEEATAAEGTTALHTAKSGTIQRPMAPSDIEILAEFPAACSTRDSLLTVTLQHA